MQCVTLNMAGVLFDDETANSTWKHLEATSTNASGGSSLFKQSSSCFQI
jgi:hypothetical protein